LCSRQRTIEQGWLWSIHSDPFENEESNQGHPGMKETSFQEEIIASLDSRGIEYDKWYVFE